MPLCSIVQVLSSLLEFFQPDGPALANGQSEKIRRFLRDHTASAEALNAQSGMRFRFA
jgi:hypothetical protein